jgi:hypothetical protein
LYPRIPGSQAFHKLPKILPITSTPFALENQQIFGGPRPDQPPRSIWLGRLAAASRGRRSFTTFVGMISSGSSGSGEPRF